MTFPSVEIFLIRYLEIKKIIVCFNQTKGMYFKLADVAMNGGNIVGVLHDVQRYEGEHQDQECQEKKPREHTASYGIELEKFQHCKKLGR